MICVFPPSLTQRPDGGSEVNLLLFSEVIVECITGLQTNPNPTLEPCIVLQNRMVLPNLSVKAL